MQYTKIIIFLIIVTGLYCVQNNSPDMRSHSLSILNTSSNSVDKTTLLGTQSNIIKSISSSIMSVKTFISSEPINITGNDEFITQTATNNWEGDGTKQDPIVINGLNISTESIAITIKNSDLFFQVSDCLLVGKEFGLKIENVCNSLIINNTISEFDNCGIVIEENSKNIGVKGNSIIGDTTKDNQVGIVIQESNANSFFNNSIFDLTNAIQVDNSQESWISYNNIYNNSYGILIDDHSDETIILNNLINYNDVGMVIESYNNTLRCNEIQDNQETGLLLLSSSSNIISSNSISYNKFNGFILNNSDNNEVYSNSFTSNGNRGLIIADSNDNAIIWNNFGENQVIDDGINNVFDYDFWSEISGHTDQDGDGIVDWRITLPGSASSVTKYPLKFGHSLKIPELDPISDDLLSQTVSLKWKSVYDTYDHYLSYSLYLLAYDSHHWELIEEGLETNEYEWETTTISNAIDCRLKVVAECSNRLVTEDISDSMFTITNELTKPIIIYPNGGEIFNESDSEIEIYWTASFDSLGHSISYSVSYTNDNGTNWNIITTGFISNLYHWNISSLSDGSYLIKVEAECESGLITEDVSDNQFIIQKHPSDSSSGSNDILSVLFITIFPIIFLSERSRRKKR